MAQPPTRSSSAFGRCLCLTACVLYLSAFGCSDAAPTAAVADEPPRADEFLSPPLEAALDAIGERLTTRGFTPQGPRRRGFLVEGTAQTAPLALRAGECSVVVVDASAALAELVIRVHGPDGGELARSAGGDTHAALRYCPPNAGVYYVATVARRGSGLYSLATYRGPNGIEFDLSTLFPGGAAASVDP